MPPRPRSVALFFLALITLGAFALRVYLLARQSLWYDEGVTVAVAQKSLVELTRWTAHDIQPPLYYYVVAGWGRLAGWSEWSLRFPSVFFGTLITPLLAAVALTLTRRRSAALLAALFGALHPLLLYYSQEARMYAMLTALSVTLAYLVIRAGDRLRYPRLHWVLYVVVGSAAVYTHYFAFFLLLAFAIAFFGDQFGLLPYIRRKATLETQAGMQSEEARPAPPEIPWFGFCLANLAIFGLYLPWLSAMIRQLAVDASYWEGPLKLAEAVRHIAISFVGGETVLEEQAIRFLLPYLVGTLLLIPILLWRNPRGWRTLLYALLWLLIPIGGVLLLAYLVPKFNARYVMVALPGLILFWSGALANLLARVTSPQSRWRTAGPVVRGSLAAVVTMVIVAGFIYADYNWFNDPAFTKAEWRQVAQFIRADTAARRQAGETIKPQVVLVSGHAWPVWNYYAPDMPPLRLPEIEILDVNAILDFANSAIPLRDGLRDETDAWLVQWQEEIVDPMNIVPLQLGLAGREERVKPQFWQLRLHHYAGVNANKVLVEPTEVSPASVNFGDQVYLLDYTLADNGDLLLFWQLHPDHADPMPDLYVTGQSYAATGMELNRLQDRRLATYEYPSFRWRPDQITLGRIPAADWAGPGALPGEYQVRLGVYDIDGDLRGLDVMSPHHQPVGKHITLNLTLPTATKGPDTDDKSAFVEMIPDFFAQISVGAQEAEPGQQIPTEIHWYAEEKPPGDYKLRLRWRERTSGEIRAEQDVGFPTPLPTSQWPDDEIVRTLHLLRPPLRLQPEDYWLEIGLTAPGSQFVAAPVRVLPTTRIFSPPPVATNVDAVFGDTLHLRGVFEPIQAAQRAGQQVALTLVWQALGRMPADYSATLQWLDAEGKIAAQADLPLPGGSTTWAPGQVELQTFIATTPTAPGDYRLVAAVYDANQTELPRLMTGDGRDLVELGVVSVIE